MATTQESGHALLEETDSVLHTRPSSPPSGNESDSDSKATENKKVLNQEFISFYSAIFHKKIFLIYFKVSVTDVRTGKKFLRSHLLQAHCTIKRTLPVPSSETFNSTNFVNLKLQYTFLRYVVNSYRYIANGP